MTTACLLPVVPAWFAVQQAGGSTSSPATQTPLGAAPASPGAIHRAVTVRRVAGVSGGGHVYVANLIQKTISQYSVGTGGELIPLTPPTLSTGGLRPGELELTPDGQNLYLSLIDESGNGQDSIGQYTVAADGSLKPLPTPMVPTEAGPIEIVRTPDGKFLYVDNGNRGVISQYSIGPSGALTRLSPPFVTPAGGAGEVTMHPSGKFLYAAGNAISQFSIDPSTGKLTALSPATAGDGANDMKVTPDGKFLYAAATGIGQYSIAASGQLTPLTPQLAAPTMNALELEKSPDGRFLYATAIDAGGKSQIEQFGIAANGQLLPLTPALVPTGNIAFEAVVSPDGGFLYVGNASFTTPNIPDTISQFSIGANGSLTPLSPATVPTGAGAGALAATPPTAVPVPDVIPTTTRYTGPISGQVGHSTILSAKLTVTASGTPLAALAIHLAFNATEGCTATTAVDGTAACTVLPGEIAGNYPLAATFAGTATYSPSSASARFVLSALTPAVVTTTTVLPRPTSTSTTSTTTKITTTTAPPATIIPVALPTGPGLPVTGGSNRGQLAGLAGLLLALAGIAALRRVRAGS